MAGLYASTQNASAFPRRRDEEELAWQPRDSMMDAPPAQPASADRMPDPALAMDGPRRDRVDSDPVEDLARGPRFAKSNSYQVASLTPMEIVSDQSTDEPTVLASASPSQTIDLPPVSFDPTDKWTPQAVVDKAVEKLQETGKIADPKFAARLVKILTEEGGYREHNNPRKVTNRGVEQRILEDITKQEKIKGLPKNVLFLNPEDYYNIYHDEFYAGKK